MATQQEILNRFVVKVVKPEPDTRISICGKYFIYPGASNHDGTAVLTENFISEGKQHRNVTVLMPGDRRYDEAEKAAYAIVPSHSATDQGLKANNKHYLFSEPFLPEEKQQSEFKCPTCGKECANHLGLVSHQRTHEPKD